MCPSSFTSPRQIKRSLSSPSDIPQGLRFGHEEAPRPDDFDFYDEPQCYIDLKAQFVSLPLKTLPLKTLANKKGTRIRRDSLSPCRTKSGFSPGLHALQGLMFRPGLSPPGPEAPFPDDFYFYDEPKCYISPRRPFKSPPDKHLAEDNAPGFRRDSLLLGYGSPSSPRPRHAELPRPSPSPRPRHAGLSPPSPRPSHAELLLSSPRPRHAELPPPSPRLRHVELPLSSPRSRHAELPPPSPRPGLAVLPPPSPRPGHADLPKGPVTRPSTSPPVRHILPATSRRKNLKRKPEKAWYEDDEVPREKRATQKEFDMVRQEEARTLQEGDKKLAKALSSSDPATDGYSVWSSESPRLTDDSFPLSDNTDRWPMSEPLCGKKGPSALQSTEYRAVPRRQGPLDPDAAFHKHLRKLLQDFKQDLILMKSKREAMPPQSVGDFKYFLTGLFPSPKSDFYPLLQRIWDNYFKDNPYARICPDDPDPPSNSDDEFHTKKWRSTQPPVFQDLIKDCDEVTPRKPSWLIDHCNVEEPFTRLAQASSSGRASKMSFDTFDTSRLTAEDEIDEISWTEEQIRSLTAQYGGVRQQAGTASQIPLKQALSNDPFPPGHPFLQRRSRLGLDLVETSGQDIRMSIESNAPGGRDRDSISPPSSPPQLSDGLSSPPMESGAPDDFPSVESSSFLTLTRSLSPPIGSSPPQSSLHDDAQSDCAANGLNNEEKAVADDDDPGRERYLKANFSRPLHWQVESVRLGLQGIKRKRGPSDDLNQDKSPQVKNRTKKQHIMSPLHQVHKPT